MPVTRREATAAAAEYKRLHPLVEAHAETAKSFDQASRTLKGYMVEEGLEKFSGIAMTETSFTSWDDGKLRAHLGEKAAEFRKQVPRRSLALLRKATRKSEA